MITEDDELIENSDAAFLSAITPKKLDQSELYPFSMMRQSVAWSLGITGKVEDGFFDAIITVWLCTKNEMEVLGAKRNKDKAIKQAFDWADEQGFTVLNFDPILQIWKKINDEIRASSNAVLAKQGTDEKNFGGQPAS